MKNLSNVIALVPAYQSEATLHSVVTGIHEHLSTVCVVDDGSTDRTSKIAEQAGAHVIRHQRNLGKGSALVSGFRWAIEQGARHIVTLDADQQHDPRDLPRFLELDDHYDLIIGQRELRWGTLPTAKFWGNTVGTSCINWLCGEQFPDTQCGFRRYSNTLLQHALPLGGRFETETQLLIHASRMGFRIASVPIATIYAQEGYQTHFRHITDTWRIARALISLLPTKSMRYQSHLNSQLNSNGQTQHE